ncbi:MarR family transcriptional regulator [Mycobacterium sp. CBMA293]|uniref:MarR family winged helix-turn-helix transcriptional regulator n=2 Tax=Mycolicibacterium TaxID=1866885 RepID=UPI0012DCB36C|nr:MULTISPECIES: MarR family transcriptional regulator [unclassified Mycolicibacterium]MUL47350.1 MarR family transcriptional regulator [Mycolicibacterium sp. CBMA 360]MUL61463.1 MarR family transcriptional regulator [Mycolicibacterium sp. CBMA 335]MUL72198.1 MarR family transcriptional regulator [Mycolicibacterium sp. CBMA 311]MUL96365.1 MarR family transcriptional regulator [Mycolicibacterium sp. CBMA 230]MUM08812.1 MarR family transcriptional regulator [Mycolicibacterium sp. CBMA 213]
MDLAADLTTDLFRTVGRFRRQLRRTAGGSFAGVTESQAELLRLVGRQPGISVREAAQELGLAANTASTLVSRLTADDLLVRSIDAADRRIGRLHLTEPAQQLADQTRAARRAALAAVLNQLDDEQIDSLTKGLNILAEMTQMLQEGQP